MIRTSFMNHNDIEALLSERDEVIEVAPNRNERAHRTRRVVRPQRIAAGMKNEVSTSRRPIYLPGNRRKRSRMIFPENYASRSAAATTAEEWRVLLNEIRDVEYYVPKSHDSWKEHRSTQYRPNKED